MEFFEDSFLMKILNCWSLLLKKFSSYRYILSELPNSFIPPTYQSLNAVFYIYSHQDIWKGPKEKQLYKCLKELDMKRIKAFRNERPVLTMIAPEVKVQNSVLIIGDD